MSEHREVAVEVTIAAPIEVVWRALRDRQELRRWHGWEFDGLDQEIEVIYFSEAVETGGDSAERQLSTGKCVIEVSGRGAGTVVRIVMAEPPDSDVWQGWYDDTVEGWITFAQQLRFALERHPGADRRTVFVSGSPQDGDGPIALLGLDGAGAPGERYAASLATGDDVTGEVWFRSAHQLGVTVAEWGDGLVVVTERHPVGAVLTAYGMDTTDLAQRWEAWWGKHFSA